MNDLTCQELVELVTDYLEGALSAEDRQRFEQHVSECDGCATYLDQMRRTVQMLGTLNEETLPAPAQEKLLAVFRQWKQENAR